MQNKGQISAEFFVIFTLLIVIFLYAITVTSERTDVYNILENAKDAELFIDTLSTNINKAFLSEGISFLVELKNNDYNIYIYNNDLYLEKSTDILMIRPLYSNNVNLDANIYNNVFVKNINGNVEVLDANS